MQRQLNIYGKYFPNFYNSLSSNTKEKIDWVFELIKNADHIPKKYFDHLSGTDGLFEIRVEYAGNIYRILCFFDRNHIIILINSFQKKTQKTPQKEIVLATRLKKQYFIDKKIDEENENDKNNKIKK